MSRVGIRDCRIARIGYMFPYHSKTRKRKFKPTWAHQWTFSLNQLYTYLWGQWSAIRTRTHFRYPSIQVSAHSATCYFFTLSTKSRGGRIQEQLRISSKKFPVLGFNERTLSSDELWAHWGQQYDEGVRMILYMLWIPEAQDLEDRSLF